MVVTKNMWATTPTITPQGQLQKWKTTQEGNMNRAEAHGRMAIQPTSARFAGKMKLSLGSGLLCLLKYLVLVFNNFLT